RRTCWVVRRGHHRAAGRIVEREDGGGRAVLGLRLLGHRGLRAHVAVRWRTVDARAAVPARLRVSREAPDPIPRSTRGRAAARRSSGGAARVADQPGPRRRTSLVGEAAPGALSPEASAVPFEGRRGLFLLASA